MILIVTEKCLLKNVLHYPKQVLKSKFGAERHYIDNCSYLCFEIAWKSSFSSPTWTRVMTKGAAIDWNHGLVRVPQPFPRLFCLCSCNCDPQLVPQEYSPTASLMIILILVLQKLSTTSFWGKKTIRKQERERRHPEKWRLLSQLSAMNY